MGPVSNRRSAQTARLKRLLLLLLAVGLAVSTYWFIPVGSGELARRTAAIFVFAALLWAMELIPLFATSLCVIGLCIFLLAGEGGLAGQGDISYRTFLEPFASNVILLFMGGLMLSAAVSKHGLDRAIASRLLQPFAARPITLLYAVMLVAAFFSMWMSNTATTAMMLAIVAPILSQLPREARFSQGLVLAVPFGANVGGIGTPIGTPPNAIALGALRQAGFSISFLDWMVIAVPFAALMIAFSGGVLYLLHRPDRDLPDLRTHESAPITPKGWATLAVMTLAVVAWLTGQLHGITDGVVALLAGTLLAALGLLDRDDINGISWSVLILMWGGLALGQAMEVTGLVHDLTDLPLAESGGLVLTAAMVLLAVTLSTFMSNTATAALMVPIALAFAIDHRGQLVVVTAFACSLAMAMPISTPPNALAFATDRISAAAMLKAGAIISIVGILLLLAGYRIVLPITIHEVDTVSTMAM